ncbi:hypothetical protein [Amycolatopsis sp. WGS_07]|uniref:hypothetical protein n=1 Tax=Amycolatopsis sp. WGS_07 TaxID=3076764 RepID=UPI0038737C33
MRTLSAGQPRATAVRAWPADLTSQTAESRQDWQTRRKFRLGWLSRASVRMLAALQTRRRASVLAMADSRM